MQQWLLQLVLGQQFVLQLGLHQKLKQLLVERIAQLILKYILAQELIACQPHIEALSKRPIALKSSQLQPEKLVQLS